MNEWDARPSRDAGGGGVNEVLRFALHPAGMPAHGHCFVYLLYSICRASDQDGGEGRRTDRELAQGFEVSTMHAGVI